MALTFLSRKMLSEEELLVLEYFPGEAEGFVGVGV